MNKTIIEPNLIVINSYYMDNNTYIILNGKEAVIIDPSFGGDDAIKAIPNDTKVVAILLTHAHFDHCYDTAKILAK
ncbi:MAG: MBL fold metallo-hydrolase [Mycoplasmoidaceae bacterium]|nr:MBL fold metallo-hydrolase [Mycoplasmoidaceae bacterium]